MRARAPFSAVDRPSVTVPSEFGCTGAPSSSTRNAPVCVPRKVTDSFTSDSMLPMVHVSLFAMCFIASEGNRFYSRVPVELKRTGILAASKRYAIIPDSALLCRGRDRGGGRRLRVGHFAERSGQWRRARAAPHRGAWRQPGCLAESV